MIMTSRLARYETGEPLHAPLGRQTANPACQLP